MKLKDKQKYEEWKAKNKDGYGRYCFTWAEKIMDYLEKEIDAYVQTMDNCFIDTADYDATMELARNTGTETYLETIFEKLAKLTAVPIASGKSQEPVVFILDLLSALEDKKC